MIEESVIILFFSRSIDDLKTRIHLETDIGKIFDTITDFETLIDRNLGKNEVSETEKEKSSEENGKVEETSLKQTKKPDAAPAADVSTPRSPLIGEILNVLNPSAAGWTPDKKTKIEDRESAPKPKDTAWIPQNPIPRQASSKPSGSRQNQRPQKFFMSSSNNAYPSIY